MTEQEAYDAMRAIGSVRRDAWDVMKGETVVRWEVRRGIIVGCLTVTLKGWADAQTRESCVKAMQIWFRRHVG